MKVHFAGVAVSTRLVVSFTCGVIDNLIDILTVQ